MEETHSSLSNVGRERGGPSDADKTCGGERIASSSLHPLPTAAAAAEEGFVSYSSSISLSQTSLMDQTRRHDTIKYSTRRRWKKNKLPRMHQCRRRLLNDPCATQQWGGPGQWEWNPGSCRIGTKSEPFNKTTQLSPLTDRRRTYDKSIILRLYASRPVQSTWSARRHWMYQRNSLASQIL